MRSGVGLAARVRGQRRVVAAGIAILVGLVVILGTSFNASGAGPADQGPRVDASRYLDFCDFDGTSGQDVSRCQAQLLDPDSATVVPKFGTVPSHPEQIQAGIETPVLGEPGPIPANVASVSTGDETKAEAAAVFVDAFSPVMQAWAATPAPHAIDQRLSDNTAVVDDFGERELWEGIGSNSAAALDAPDLELVSGAVAGTFRPRDPVIPGRVGATTDDMISLPGASVSLKQEGGTSVSGAKVDGGIFYADAAADSDLFVQPVPAGYQFAAQFRSQTSPEELRLRIESKQEDRVIETSDGGAAILRAGEPVASISPAVALQADGTPLPVDLSVVDDQSITLHVAHRGMDIAYPILVDPVISEWFDWSSGIGNTTWSAYESDPDYDHLASAFGLMSSVASGKSLAANTQSRWSYFVPNHGNDPGSPQTSAYIADIDVGALGLSTGSTNQVRPRADFGTYDTASQSFVRRAYWLSAFGLTNTTLKTAAPSLQNGHTDIDSKLAHFSLYTDGQAVTTNSQRTAYLTNVTVKLDDTDVPQGTINGSSIWTDGGDSPADLVDAGDGGLGIKTINYIPGWDKDEQWSSSQTVTSACTGGAQGPCPQNWQQSFTPEIDQLRDGLQLRVAGLVDVLGKGAILAEWYGIDRQAPEIVTLAVDEEGMLEISAKDGDPGTRNTDSPADRSGAESGVTSIELLNGTEVVDSVTKACEGDGIDDNGSIQAEIPWQSCELDATFDLPTGFVADTGTAVRVVDAAGNVVTQQFDTTGPAIELSGELAEFDGQPLDVDSASMQISLEDQGLDPQGVASVVVTVDDSKATEIAYECEPTCNLGEHEAFTYDRAAWGQGPHIVTVLATDRAGNESMQVIEVDPEQPTGQSCPTTAAVQDTGSEATQQQAVDALPSAAVAPSEPAYADDIDSTLDPTLSTSEEPPAPLASAGTIGVDEFPSTPAGDMTLDGMICIAPKQTTAAETQPLVVNEDAAVYANTATETDTVLRPVAAGVQIVESRRSELAPTEFTWHLGLPEGAELRELDNGGIAVVDPSFPAVEPAQEGENPPEVWVPPAPEVDGELESVADSEAQMEVGTYEAAVASAETGLQVIAVLPRPTELHSVGTVDSADLSVTGSNDVTATVSEEATAMFLTLFRPFHSCELHVPHRFNTYFPHSSATHTWWVNVKMCVLRGRQQIFARFSLTPAPTPYVSARLQVRLANRDKVVRTGPVAINPSFSDEAPFHLRSDGVKWRSVRNWCGELWQQKDEEHFRRLGQGLRHCHRYGMGWTPHHT